MLFMLIWIKILNDFNKDFLNFEINLKNFEKDDDFLSSFLM